MKDSLVLRLRLILLLRDAGTPVVSVIAAIRLAAALLPAATALSAGAVIHAVERSTGSGGSLGTGPTALIVLGAALVTAQLCTALDRPLTMMVDGRISAAHRERVATLLLNQRTITAAERPETQNLIQAAAPEVTYWAEKTVADGALSQLNVLAQLVGLIASALVLARYSWWLAPPILFAGLIIRQLTLRQWLAVFRTAQSTLSDLRRSRYWNELAIAPTEGKELRIFGLTDWLLDHALHHQLEVSLPTYVETEARVRRKWLFALVSFVPLTAVFLVVGLGCVHRADGLSIETVVLTSAWAVFSTVAGTWDSVNVIGALPAMAASAQLRRQLFEPPHPGVADRPPEPLPSTDVPLVRLEGIGFGYPGAARRVLDGLDLEIRPSELLAVVGLNGAGKSTLVKVLSGLYAPDSGRVTADGADIAGLGPADWPGRISLVFQDFVKYQLTVRENVALGSAGPVREELLEIAAAESGFSAVLDRLPHGWDTMLGRGRKGGVDLSGGQWQRLVLARALYAVCAGARVLVLDEPTAHLDVRTELEVFQSIGALCGKGIAVPRPGSVDVPVHASVVLISHRLSTVRQADRIVLLEDGGITESGTHEELMELGGGYAGLFNTQAQRFAEGYTVLAEDEEAR